MKSIVEKIYENLLVEEYNVFKEDKVMNLLSNDDFQRISHCIYDACKKYGKPKGTNSAIKRFTRNCDQDLARRISKLYDLKDVDKICDSLDNTYFNFSSSKSLNWFDTEVQLLAILFLVGGWIVTGAVSEDEVYECNNMSELKEYLINIICDKDYPIMYNLWNIATTIQVTDIYKAFEKLK